MTETGGLRLFVDARVAFITRALARYQLSQATVRGYKSLLRASGLGGIWTQIFTFLGFMSLGTALGMFPLRSLRYLPFS